MIQNIAIVSLSSGILGEAASQKVFLGFSDTTINHLMLHDVPQQVITFAPREGGGI